MIGATLYGEITTKIEQGFDREMGIPYKYFFLEQDGQDLEIRIYTSPKKPTFVETTEGKVVNRFNGKELTK